MGRPGAFKSEKRKKELTRLKKREEKMQKRQGKRVNPDGSVEAEARDEVQAGEGPQETTPNQ